MLQGTLCCNIDLAILAVSILKLCTLIVVVYFLILKVRTRIEIFEAEIFYECLNAWYTVITG
jgi:hypothetical protein